MSFDILTEHTPSRQTLLVVECPQVLLKILTESFGLVVRSQ